MTARRMAGSVGLGGPCFFLFFPLYLVQTLMLQEGVSDHCHQCVSVEALPGPAFEVIETKLFLHLLMSLLTDPSRFDGRR